MITVSELTKDYRGQRAVDDLSFVVPSGRVTGFVGPNGAGKSTTMRMMVGLTRPDRGDVHYDGVAYRNLDNPAYVVGAVLDTGRVHPGRTARDHLRALAAISDIAPCRVDEVLDETGLESVADQRAGGFSLGMGQRLALAGALLGRPRVLLLDEPSNGLDPDGIRWLRGYLRRFADQGGTVFVSSHLIAELAMFADDLVVLGAGKLLVADTVQSIAGGGTRTVVVETPDAGRLVHLLGPDAVTDVDGDRIVIHGATKQTVSEMAFDHRIRLREITEVARSLEDTLLDITAASAAFTSTATPHQEVTP